ALALLPAACRVRASADETDAGGVHGAVAVQTAAAAAQRFARVVNAIGTVTPRPGRFAELAAPGPTRVARLCVALGRAVAAAGTAGEGALGAPLGAGVVTGVAAAVDSLSRAVAVRARVRRAERRLRIGESLFGRIVTALEPRAVTVPVAALVPAAGGEGFQV